MVLLALNLLGFKNYSEKSFSFKPGINCIVGKNGVGKTNLLDSIHYLCYAKTALLNTDVKNIHNDDPYFVISGEFENNLRIACKYERNKSKTLKVDGVLIQKLSHHLGDFPLVFIAPDDTAIVKERILGRKIFDETISQFDKPYLSTLMRYNKLLNQRNEWLKQNLPHNAQNFALLDTYDDQMVPLALCLSKRRKEFVEHFQHPLLKMYKTLCADSETPSIVFDTEIDEHFKTNLRQSRSRDLVMQRTLLGSHRDQYQFLIDNQPIKYYGSQGQKKTFILAFKLAIHSLLKDKTGKMPLLLLDDVFDKLDPPRIHALTSLLKNESWYQQVFITDASDARCLQFFDSNAINIVKL